MKKSFLSGAAIVAAAFAVAGAAHAEDTLKKIKDSGTITMGVRESSGALAYTLGDGKYIGFHVEVCQHDRSPTSRSSSAWPSSTSSTSR